MEKNDDDNIMLLVKSGDLASLASLFEKYHMKLYNFFLRATKSREASQDLTQDVFQRIMKYRHTYDPDWPFRSWMYQIARNIQKQYFNNNKILISDFQDSEKLSHESTTALEKMENDSKNNMLYEALSRLNEEQREIIELARFQGLKYKEIAKITNNSEVAIKVKVHRAIKRLRELYFELV